MRLERYDRGPRRYVPPPSILVLEPFKSFGRELRPDRLQRHARLMKRPRICLSLIFSCEDYLSTSKARECESIVEQEKISWLVFRRKRFSHVQEQLGDPQALQHSLPEQA